MRRRILGKLQKELSLSITNKSVSPASGSFTVTVYLDDEILKDSQVSVIGSGQVSSVNYNSSTGIISVSYSRNTNTSSKSGQVLVTYDGIQCSLYITQSGDYVSKYQYIVSSVTINSLSVSSYTSLSFSASGGVQYYVPASFSISYTTNKYTVYASGESYVSSTHTDTASFTLNCVSQYSNRFYTAENNFQLRTSFTNSYYNITITADICAHDCGKSVRISDADGYSVSSTLRLNLNGPSQGSSAYTTRGSITITKQGASGTGSVIVTVS